MVRWLGYQCGGRHVKDTGTAGRVRDTGTGTQQSLTTGPIAEGEREPRWLGQWDAVACEHVFVHRLTHAVRRGPFG